MHKFTPKQITSIIGCLNRSQPQAHMPASVLNCVRQEISYALLPTVEQIDDTRYFTLPGTNLTLIARPIDGRCHWSALTEDGKIYNNELVELVKVFLNEDGREHQFMIEKVAVKGGVVWVDGGCNFSLEGAK